MASIIPPLLGAPSPRTRRATLALALLWLGLGYANISRGLLHTGPRYRFWSFQHLCYSDVIAMHGDRYLGGGHPRPYLDDKIEYPVLLGLLLWLPHWVPGGAAAHFTVTYLFLSACLLAALLALERIPGARPAWLGATPALALYAGLNWDLFPILLLALAALELYRRRHAAAAAAIGLGISAKLFPGVLLLPAAGALWGGAEPGRGRRLTISALVMAGVILVVNLPVAVLAPEGWSWFFRFNAGRGAENSAWHALGLPPGPLLELVSAGPLLAASAFALWASRAAARQGEAGRAVRLGAALALTVWIATNKVWSPQYALYGFLAGALVAAPWPLFAPLSAVSLLDYWVAFEVRGRRWDPGFRDHLFHPVGLVRTLLWLALAAWMARELWREARVCAESAAPDGRDPSGRAP
jgi:hypothetical protein